jgi:hypothetical protein
MQDKIAKRGFNGVESVVLSFFFGTRSSLCDARAIRKYNKKLGKTGTSEHWLHSTIKNINNLSSPLPLLYQTIITHTMIEQFTAAMTGAMQTSALISTACKEEELTISLPCIPKINGLASSRCLRKSSLAFPINP